MKFTLLIALLVFFMRPPAYIAVDDTMMGQKFWVIENGSNNVREWIFESDSTLRKGEIVGHGQSSGMSLGLTFSQPKTGDSAQLNLLYSGKPETYLLVVS